MLNNFLLSGLEQGWNTNEDNQTDHFGPFATPRMSQMGSQRVPQVTKYAKNSLLAKKQFSQEGQFLFGRGRTKYCDKKYILRLLTKYINLYLKQVIKISTMISSYLLI